MGIRGALRVAAWSLTAVAGVAFAQSGGPYRIERSTVDAGGGRSGGGAYALEGTVGQPDAARASGGVYALSGGFWIPAVAAVPAPDALFANGFEELP